MSVIAEKELAQEYLTRWLMDDFRQVLLEGCFSHDLAGLNAIGQEKLNQTGLPSRKNEDFTYVSLDKLAAARLQMRKEPSHTTSADVERLLTPNTKFSRVVFVDGIFMENLSDISGLRGQAELLPLDSAFNEFPDVKNEILARAMEETDPLANINSSFVLNGAFLRIKEGQALSSPLEILFIATENGQGPLFAAPRLVVRTEPGAQASIILKRAGEARTYLHNAVEDIRVMENARLDIQQLSMSGGKSWSFDKLKIDQDKGSQVRLLNASTGSRLTRFSYHWRLMAPDAAMELKALGNLDDGVQNHYHAKIVHMAPDCSSDILFKNIVNGESRSSVDSSVQVDRGAMGTASSQLLRNLLLSEGARADNKPNLMIYADDVQCSHGATISQLDEESLFYMRSRGISREAAARSMTLGFAREVANEFKDEYVKALVESNLSKNLGDAL